MTPVSIQVFSVATLLLCSVASASVANCFGCRPWNPQYPCKVGDLISTKVMADVNPYHVDQAPYNNVSYVTYGYCQEVDQLQSLHIVGYLNDTMLTDTDNFGYNDTAYLRLYGLGSNQATGDTIHFPRNEDSASIVLAQALPDLCPGGIAVATFLVLNITMKDGLIHYRDNGDPLFTGFQSTCSGGVCLFGPDGGEYPCIGNERSSNCAKCVYNSTVNSMLNTTVSLWVSYYGTDVSGTPFVSGQENPINFREFALNSAYDDLAGSISIP